MLAEGRNLKCVLPNGNATSMESGDWGDSWFIDSMVNMVIDHLRQYQLEAVILGPRGSKIMQVIWRAVLLGYALAAAVAGIATRKVNRRLLIPMLMLLAIMTPIIRPHLHTTCPPAVFRALAIGILEASCVVSLLSTPPLGPAAAVVAVILRLGAALGLPVLKSVHSLNALWRLQSFFSLAPTLVFLVLLCTLHAFQCSITVEGIYTRRQARSARANVLPSASPTTTTHTPQGTAAVNLEKASSGRLRDQKKKRCSAPRKKFQHLEVELRRSARKRRPVDRFDPASYKKFV